MNIDVLAVIESSARYEEDECRFQAAKELREAGARLSALLDAASGAIGQLGQALAAATSTTAGVGDWGIDTSAGRPILVFQNCSVIEAEQAEFVLGLIAAHYSATETKTGGLDAMVSRFLGWKLPQDFAPDAGISFTPPDSRMDPPMQQSCWPIGTNLLTAIQARAMLEHVVCAAPAEAA